MVVNLEKEDIEKLSWKEDDLVDRLTKGKVGIIRIVEHCKNHLISTG